MSRTLKRRPVRITLTSLVAALLALSIGASFAYAVKPPKVTASLGDSITRAFNTHPAPAPGCPTFIPPGILDCPKNSWSTGTDPAVNSQYQRIQAIDPGREPVAFNDAVSGARMIHLQGQATAAVSQGADYVTILMGANDACRQTIALQTPTAIFRSQFQAAIDTIRDGLPKAYIQVVSIPDINQLHTLFTSPVPDPNAIIRWSPGVLSATGTCQALLLSPLSSATLEVDRRAAFRAQVIAYNEVLADVCGAVTQNRCKYDGGAGFNASFTTSDVANVTNTGSLGFPIPVFGPGAIPGSTADYFHPSKTGQALIAELSWANTFSFE